MFIVLIFEPVFCFVHDNPSFLHEWDVVFFRILFGVGAGGHLEGELFAFGETVRSDFRYAGRDGNGLHIWQAPEAARSDTHDAVGDHDGFQRRR